jgi:hypothetical protein
MIPRLKKVQKVEDSHFTKEQFLEEHNRLSPASFKATASILSRFKTEKPSLFKDNYWSVDKLRRPFIDWFSSMAFSGKDKDKDK